MWSVQFNVSLRVVAVKTVNVTHCICSSVRLKMSLKRRLLSMLLCCVYCVASLVCLHPNRNNCFSVRARWVRVFTFSTLSPSLLLLFLALASRRNLLSVVQQLYQRVIRLLRTTLWSNMPPSANGVTPVLYCRFIHQVSGVWPPALIYLNDCIYLGRLTFYIHYSICSVMRQVKTAPDYFIQMYFKLTLLCYVCCRSLRLKSIERRACNEVWFKYLLLNISKSCRAAVRHKSMFWGKLDLI